MSRDWTAEELQAVSKAMKAAGFMSYEEFCDELEKQNKQPNAFEAEYNKECGFRKAYEKAKEENDEAGIAIARQAHKLHMLEISEIGKLYASIYREYESSRDAGNELLDLNDVIWGKDVDKLIKCLRANGTWRFTFSSTWSGAVQTAWLFQQSGCRMEGMAQINGRTRGILSGEREKVPAFVFSIVE